MEILHGGELHQFFAEGQLPVFYIRRVMWYDPWRVQLGNTHRRVTAYDAPIGIISKG